MKKIFRYIFITFIFLLVFINSVDAATVCGGGGYEIITEDRNKGQPALFNVTLPVCEQSVFTGQYSVIKSTNQYPEVRAEAFKQVETFYSEADNKGYGVTNVSKCADPKAKIDAYIKMNYYIDASYEPVKELAYVDCTSKSTEYNCTNAEGGLCKWVVVPGTAGGNGGNNNTDKGGEDSPVHVNPGNGNGKGNGKIKGYNQSAKVSDDSLIAAAPTGYCTYKVAGNNSYLKTVYENGKVKYDWKCPSTLMTVKVKDGEHVCYYYDSIQKAQECLSESYHVNDDGECVAGAPSKPNEVANVAYSELKEKIQNQCDRAMKPYASRNGKCEVDIIYSLYCPKYKCIETHKNISACTPSFENSKGNPAYCVNPSDLFPSGGLYQIDNTFDVTKCQNSFNTVDCGYANIMIQGSADRDSTKAIELAMRLWGVHTGQGGFNKFGLSSLEGAACTNSVIFMSTGKYTNNIYKLTYDYIMQYKFQYIDKLIADGYINTNSEASDFSISCASTHTEYETYNDHTYPVQRVNNSSIERLGVTCSGANDYQNGIALLFSTIFGNKKMKDQLGVTDSTEPIYAEYIEDNDGKHYVYVRYEEQKFNDAFEKVEKITINNEPIVKNDVINCDSLNKLGKDSDAYKEFAPYCQTRVVVMKGDKVIYDGGDPAGTNPNGARLAECRKGVGCYKLTTLKGLVCKDTTTNQPTHIKVYYKAAREREKIVKYITCGNTDNQHLYSYNGISVNVNETININVIKESEKGEKTFEVSTYACSGCTNANVAVDNNYCKNNLENYNGRYESSIKEPSLKCIVNLTNKNDKYKYDYSDYFKVNTDICRIYCSDEVDYYIADKVKVNSDRSFIYNIPVADTGFEGKKKIPPLVSIIKEKRSCVSEIYYDKAFPDPDSVKTRYGLTDDDINYIRKNGYTFNWQTLNYLLYEKAVGNDYRKIKGENSRGDNINQIIYDLYNCNLFTGKKNGNNYTDNFEFTSPTNNKSYTIKKPQDNKSGNIRKRIEQEYSDVSKLLKLPNNVSCTIDGSNGTKKCFNHNNITYKFASAVDAKNDGAKIGVEVGEFKFNNIKYCKNTKNFKCFNYSVSDTSPYDYAGLSEKSSLDITSSYYKYNLSGISYYGVQVPIPTNDYAYFDVSVDVGFYNTSVYEVQPDTARVFDVTKGTSKGYIRNDEYTFPTDKYSFNNTNACTKISASSSLGVSQADADLFNDTLRRCTINQTFSDIATFYRKSNSDTFARAINDHKSFACYVDVYPPGDNRTSEEVFYRNVDSEKLFPENYKEGPNWRTDIGKYAITVIENKASKIPQLQEPAQYTITLTPVQINNIKEYNASGGASYQNETINENTCKQHGSLKFYYNCKSKGFLDILRYNNPNNKYGTLDYDSYGKLKLGVVGYDENGKPLEIY